MHPRFRHSRESLLRLTKSGSCAGQVLSPMLYILYFPEEIEIMFLAGSYHCWLYFYRNRLLWLLTPIPVSSIPPSIWSIKQKRNSVTESFEVRVCHKFTNYPHKVGMTTTFQNGPDAPSGTKRSTWPPSSSGATKLPNFSQKSLTSGRNKFLIPIL